MPAAARLPVLKTHKLFIGGRFPRSESGRTLTAVHAKSGRHLAHYSRASRKDLRDAITAARSGAAAWSAATPYLRGQILYRLAEMVEARAPVLTDELAAATGVRATTAARETAQSVDQLVHLAGWTDKLAQVFSTVNPVAAPFFNFSTLEPSGVAVLFAPDMPAVLGAASLIGCALATGNACVLVASEKFPTLAITLAEAVATSDVPAGAVNILTGLRGELAPVAADHRDIDAIVDASGAAELAPVLDAGAAVNLKRVQRWNDISVTPWRLLGLTETKTTWHPASA